MSKLNVYRTVSFWACCVMVVVNLTLFFIGTALQSEPLRNLAILTMVAAAVGAWSHWYLSEKYSKK